MAYVTPPTFVAAATLAAADLNVLAADIVYLKAQTDALAFSGVSLHEIAGQSIGSSLTGTPVNWASAPVMEGGTWWTSGSTVTVPTGTVAPGWTKAVLECQLVEEWAANGVGVRSAIVLLNGTGIDTGLQVSAISGENTVLETTAWALVADGDVIKGSAAQNSGGSLNLATSSLHIKRIGFV